MKNFRKNQGITLIALVITVIVLLILAGITINMLSGENGLLNRATEATEEHSKSEARERVELLLGEYAIEKETGENTNFAKFLRKNLHVGVAQNEDNTYSFLLGEWQVVATENEVISIEKFKLDVDKTYPSVASMKDDTELTEGQLVQTEGYWDKQYAGGAYYDIVSSTSLTVDDGKCIQLDNGLYAELHAINDTITINQFGAYGDGVHDDSNSINLALNAGYGNVSFESEKYKFGQTIRISTNNLSIIGNNATLLWDEETNVVFNQVFINGTSSAHIQNINIYYLNFENNYVNMGDIAESVQLLCRYCDNINIENCNFIINEISNDTSRKITNTWFAREWSNINIKNCNYKNLTYGNVGGNVWLSADDTENPNYISQNVKIENNQFEKSCHDESIGIWGGAIRDITIDNNAFNIHEENVESPSDINFTFGNTGGIVENIYFTNNKVVSESNAIFAVCFGETESKNIYINNNDIQWTLLRENGAIYAGFIGTRNTENVIISDNNIKYDTSENAYLYSWASSRGIEYNSNNIEINGDVKSLSNLENIETYSNTKFNNNVIRINGNITSLYEGYEFCGNTVEINGKVGEVVDESPVIFKFYGKTLYGDVNIINNKIDIKNQENISLPFLFLYNSRINGYSINLTNNNINYDTAGIGQLTHIQNMLDEEEQQININDNEIIGYREIYFLDNIVNPIVIFNGRKITTTTTIE